MVITENISYSFPYINTHVAIFNKLKEACNTKTKTKNITYGAFGLQEYLYQMDPAKSRIVFRIRARMLSTKTDMQKKFINQNSFCRLCKKADESIQHIVNCGRDDLFNDDQLNTLLLEKFDIKMASRVADRIKEFMDAVSQ